MKKEEAAKPFTLRMSKSLKKDIKSKAKDNSRTLTSEIIHRLKESLKPKNNE